MEKIVLEVPDSTAQKWQKASANLKRRAADMLVGLLAKPDDSDIALAVKGNRTKRVKDAQEFFTNLSADFTGYRFNRDEANER